MGISIELDIARAILFTSIDKSCTHARTHAHTHTHASLGMPIIDNLNEIHVGRPRNHQPKTVRLSRSEGEWVQKNGLELGTRKQTSFLRGEFRLSIDPKLRY